MGEVIDIGSMKPHLGGKVQCLCCNHVWDGVAPAGTTWLECPKCKTLKGTFAYPALIDDESHWQCSCGNKLFYIIPSGCYCPMCGKRVNND